MGSFTPTFDEEYRRYADLLLTHHRLLSEGEDEADETVAVEYEMTELWGRLDAVQRRSLSGLGSDLNWVRRRSSPPPRGRKPEDVTTQDSQSLDKVTKDSDWHGVLHHLRICGPLIPPFELAHRRAFAWVAVEMPPVAGVFYDFAAGLEPSNGSIAVLALRTADRVDPAVASARAWRIVEDPYRHPAVVVTQGAAMLLREAERTARPINRPLFADLLRSSLDRLQLEQTSEAERAMAFQLAAVGFETLGELPEALRCYEEGLKLRPDSDDMLVGKGLLLYGRQSDRAAEAFARAAEHRFPFVWPYFFLAHYHLVRRQFDRCLSYSSQGREIATSDPVRAELLEWSAISQSALSYPDEAVVSLFRQAIALDPTNERIARNLRAFESSRNGPIPLQWDVESEGSLKVRRAAEAKRQISLAAA